MDVQANKRIDAGIKRGPKAQYRHKPPARRLDTATGTIPEGLSPDLVLERYLTESTTSQIAASYGVSRKTLVRWLYDQRPDEWKRVQVIRALCRKDDADDGMEVACDALSLARAREQLKSAQFDLERLDARTWGQQNRVEMTVTGDLGERLLRARERVIDAESTVIAAPAQLSNNKQLQPDAPQQTGNGPA